MEWIRMMTADLITGWQLHQAGRGADAARYYDAVLARHPDHADALHLAARCRDYRRLMEHWQTVLPVSVHEVVYEKLVDDFQTEAPRLLAACGLKWEPACERFHQTARPVRKASLTQVRQPIYRRALARWKNYEATLGDLFAGLPVD
jgi:hypothetical protein